jgi:hypothetical protein
MNGTAGAGTITPTYVDLRFPDGKIAARYDPVRGILEMRHKGAMVYFDLVVCGVSAVEEPPKVAYNFDE